MGTVAKLKYGDTTHLIASTCYGTCPTEAGTVAKVATIQDSQAFSLINGITIHIKFTYSNTADNPTLNVNSTGAKAIKMYGTTATGKTATASWYAGSVVSFTYDGTNWIQNDYKVNTNTTYSAGTGLSLSSTTFNHSNSVTAQTTQKVYPIKIDAQGHISAYGTSPTTLSGYGITDAVLKSGDTMTGSLTIKVTSTHDDNSPSCLLLQAVDSTNNVTSTGYIMAYNGGANGANLVIQPGGNMFLGSGEAALNHYNSAYTHSTTETMYITSDGGIHIQANGQTIANRVGVQIDSSGNLVPDKADVATNNIGGIGTSTYKWANGYFYNINGVAVGDSPEFTDAKVAQTATTTNATYEILFSETASNDDLTEGAGKTSTLTFNPSTNLLSTTTVRTSNALEVNNTTTNGSQVRFRFRNLSSSQYATMFATREANHGGRLSFRQYSENSSGTLLSKYETYSLPIPAQGLSANKAYTIVTTKDGLDVLTGYGTCSTAAATVAKTASVTGLTALTTGATIRIKFTNANTASNPTLNVNSLGAKSIMLYGTNNVSKSELSWKSNQVVTLTYDGTYWQIVDWTKRDIQLDGTSIGENPLNIKAGNNVSIAPVSNAITFSIPSTTAPTYTVTSSSSSNKWSDASIVATRWGNVVQIVLRLSGTGSSVTAGTDGYTGTVSGTYMPSRQVTLMGYTGKTLLMGWLETNGTLTVRANEATQVASGNGLWLTGTFVTDTDTTG